MPSSPGAPSRVGSHARRYCLALYPGLLCVREEREDDLMSLEYPLTMPSSLFWAPCLAASPMSVFTASQRLSIIFPGSHCPSCQEALRPRHNIPLLSYLLRRTVCQVQNGHFSTLSTDRTQQWTPVYIFVPSLPSLCANCRVCTPHHGSADRLLYRLGPYDHP